MKIFVTGGTGTIGNILVSNLLEAGHEVTVITRSISRVTHSWKDEVTLVEGNVLEDGHWLSSLENQDAIINLVGENIFGKRWSQEQKDRIIDSRVIPTTLMVTKIKEMTTPPQVFVSVSGTDYYPASETEVFEESASPASTFTGEVTVEWEKPVRRLEGSQTRYVIFRMGVAFTYTGNAAERMFLPHKFFVGGWIGSGRQIYSWIHQDDFVGLLQWAVENPEIEGTYNGVAPEYKPMKELATIGGQVMGRWTWTWAPGFVLKLVLGERADLLLKGRAVSPQKLLDAGFEFKYPNAREALEDVLYHY